MESQRRRSTVGAGTVARLRVEGFDLTVSGSGLQLEYR